MTKMTDNPYPVAKEATSKDSVITRLVIPYDPYDKKFEDLTVALNTGKVTSTYVKPRIEGLPPLDLGDLYANSDLMIEDITAPFAAVGYPWATNATIRDITLPSGYTVTYVCDVKSIHCAIFKINKVKEETNVPTK